MIRTYDITTGELIDTDATVKMAPARAAAGSHTDASMELQLLETGEQRPAPAILPVDLATVAVEPFLRRQR